MSAARNLNKLRIHTHINSRYPVFDLAGQLPFSIVFGLCRRPPADDEPRSVLLDTAGSVFDVPFALAHGLLTLQEQSSEDAEQWAKVDLSRLGNVAAKEAEYLSIPSPVNRTEHWSEAFTVYFAHIDVNDEMASILEPGKKYRIRLASQDLGVKRWAYIDQQQSHGNDGIASSESETKQLVNLKSTSGNATFTVVEGLPWPPRIDTRMRLRTTPSLPTSELAITNPSSNITLEVSVLNTSADAVTVQARDQQRFLIPWGPFQPESDDDDDRLRIIDVMLREPPGYSLLVINSATGKVVRGNEKWRFRDAPADFRPWACSVVVLRPGIPVIRTTSVGARVDGLEDGEYKIRLQAMGCRWWRGEVGEEDCDENGRMPAHPGGILIPPLMLES